MKASFTRFSPNKSTNQGEWRLANLAGADWKRIGTLVFSFLLALIFFQFSRQPSSDLRLQNVPIDFIDIPAGLEITHLSASAVNLRLRGPRDLVRGLNASQLAVTANLSNKTAGERVVQLHPRNISLPSGVEAIQIDPTSLKLTLEPTARKTIKISPQVSGPDESVELYRITTNPTTIEIEGPQSQLALLTELKTESIVLTGKRVNFQTSVDIELPQNNLRTLNRAPVEVFVEMGERRLSHLIQAVPVNLLGKSPAPPQLLTKTVDVLVFATLADRALLNERTVQAHIELATLPANATLAKPTIKLPDALLGRVEVRSILPANVQLKR